MPDRRLGTTGRLISAFLALALLTVLGVAAWLHPDPSGHGTHTQLGMTPCGWEMVTGYPCPTCGMTTSFAHAADAHFAASFVTQPLGAVLAVLTSAVFWGAVHVGATGSRIGAVAATMIRPATLWALALLAAAAWIYKILAT